MNQDNAEYVLRQAGNELGAMVRGATEAACADAGVPSVMGSIWNNVVESCDIDVHDLDLSDELKESLKGCVDIVQQLLVAM